jgi:hypothetical protein
MRETRQSGSEGGEVQINEPSLPLSETQSILIMVPMLIHQEAVS